MQLKQKIVEVKHVHTVYEGKFIYENQSIFFGLAEKKDAQQIAELYKSISINAENYKIRLNNESPYSFKNIGGMYEILSKEEILEEIDNDKSLFAVAKDEKGNIVSSFWFSQFDPFLSSYMPEKEKFKDRLSIYNGILCAKAENKMVYPRELIVSDKGAPPKIASLMFYSIFVAMQKIGYTHSLCEVYKLLGYNDGSGEKNEVMLNERSFAMTQKTGGIYIDKSPVRILNLPNLTVKIEAQIFYFDYKSLLPKLEKYFQEKNIKIEWGPFHEKGNQI